MREEADSREDEEMRRQIKEAKDRYTRSLLDAEAAAAARREAELERQEHERRKAEEKEKLEEQRRLKQIALDLEQRKQDEETKTQRVLPQLAKKCPGCQRPIQKNGGW
ncbi:hypothetical protein F5Y18DRAFT_432406 [Xylariaceae sp. FL1019]|nr:hypothetical protein F5Y18DRAFT_432406 [Xylariaceae sp. FL1019]